MDQAHINRSRKALAIAIAATHEQENRLGALRHVMLAIFGSMVLIEAAIVAYHTVPMLQP